MANITNLRGTIHYDKFLTNLALAYQSQEQSFIAEKLFPPVIVGKQSDKYVTFDSAYGGRRVENDVVTDRTAPNKIISWKVSDSAYYCDSHGLSDDWTPGELKNQDKPLDANRDTMQGVMENILLNKEVNLKNLIWDSSNFTNTAAAATKWDADGGSAVDPRVDVNTGMRTIRLSAGLVPNMMVINYDIYEFLTRSPYLATYLSDAADKDVNLKKIAAFFRIEQVMIAEATYNSAKQGQTVSDAFIWDDKVLLCYVAKRPQMKTPSFGYSFEWDPEGIGGGRRVQTFQQQRPRVNFVDVYNYYTQEITYNTAGYLITDVLT